MWQLIIKCITKLIPTNWYEVKKQCDMVTKICDTLIELKWFVFPCLSIAFICICIMAVFFFKWQIQKIKGAK